MRTCVTRFALLGLVLALQRPLLRAELFLLADQGRAAATVVLGARPTEDERLAADELVNYIKRTTGAVLPVVSGTPKDPAVLIRVGLSACPPAAARQIQALRGEGYLIEVLPDRQVILAGKGRRGTSFAVYEFLERFAGVRWLWPGTLGEVVPRRPTLSVETVSLAREPAFVWRALGPGGALWGPADRWQKERELGVSAEHQEQQRLWERRNRFGGELIQSGHAFGHILPPDKYGRTHPEYYALVNGERDWRNFNGKHRAQLCTTNPEVVRLVIEYCRQAFNEHPEYDAVSISPNDGRGFCECDRCLRLDTGETQADRADPETGRATRTRVITDRMITFANEVAEGVAKTHPGKKVLLLAYSQYRQPPKRTRANGQVIVQYAVNSAGFWNPAYRTRVLEDLEGWSKMTQNLAVYEYLTQGNFPDIPRLIPDLIALELRELRRLGASRYETQAGNGFAVNGFNFYVLARLLWNPADDCREIMEDYVTSGFGKAAPAVKRYLDLHIERWKSMQSAPVAMNDGTAENHEEVLRVYPTDFRDACRRSLQEARRLADGDARKRVDFLYQGFDYFDMTMRAVEKTLPLLRAGWRPSAGLEGPPSVERARILDAMEAWEERECFVERHREDFVLSYMWVRYNDILRTFNPLRRYREVAERQGRKE